MFVRNCWYVAGWGRDFTAGAITPVTLLNEPVILYRKSGGELVALEDRCCHRLAPLSLGRQEADDIRCMYHGLKFAPDGRCIEIPGQDRIPPSARVRAYPIVERHSCAWIWMGDPAEADEGLIPDFVGVDDPRWAMRPGRMDYDASYELVSDNLLDLSHIPYVHQNSFGGGDEGANAGFAASEIRVVQLERGVRVSRDISNSPSPPFLRDLTGPLIDAWISYDFLIPGVFLLRSAYYQAGALDRGLDDSGEPTEAPVHESFTCQAVTPITDRKTCYFFGFGPRAEKAEYEEMYYQMGVKAFAEDKIMIDAQQRLIDATANPRMLPLGMDAATSLFRTMMERQTRKDSAAA